MRSVNEHGRIVYHVSVVTVSGQRPAGGRMGRRTYHGLYDNIISIGVMTALRITNTSPSIVSLNLQ